MTPEAEAEAATEERTGALLAAVPWLAALGEEASGRLGRAARPVRLPAGAAVEEPGEALLILKGTARLLARGVDGEERALERVGRGQVAFSHRLLEPPAGDRPPRTLLRPDGPIEAVWLPAEALRAAAAAQPALDAPLRTLAHEGARLFLERAAALAPLDPEAAAALLGALVPRPFRAGEALAEAAAPAPGLGIICAGRARREAHSADSAPRLLAAGDWFGDAALALGTPEPAAVTALSEGHLLWLDGRAFEREAAAQPALRRLLGALVSALAARGRPAAPSARAAELEPIEPAAGPGAAAASADDDDADDVEETFLRERPTGWASRLLRRSLGRYPFRFQPESTDCGPACLGMVAAYHGRPVRHARLRELACVSREGCSLASLAEGAESIGLLARGVAAELDELPKVALPAIAHVDKNHFVVIYEADRTHLLIADPGIGLERVTREAFARRWDGALLLLRPAPKEPTPAERVRAAAEGGGAAAAAAFQQGGQGRVTGLEPPPGLARFFPYLSPYRAVLGEVLVAAMALQLLGLVVPFATQTVIDRVFVHAEVGLLHALLAATLGAAVFTALITTLRSLLLYDVVRLADRALVSDFHHRLFRLPLRFFGARKLGDILVRFSDNQKVRSFLVNVALGSVLDVLMASVYLTVILVYDVRLALVGLAPLPLLALLTLVVTPRLRRIRRELAVRQGEAQSALVESLNAVLTVKGCSAEANERRRYEGLFDRLLEAELRGVRLTTISGALGGLIVAAGQALVLYYGAMRVLDGALSIGAFVAFMALLSMVVGPALRLVGVWEQFQETAVSLERLGDVLDAEPEEARPEALLDLPPLEGHVRLDEVTFRYERDLPPALEGISLEVLPGERVAVVGRSGAGKTTFVHLLLKLHTPEQGAVLIDGHDLRGVRARSLRRQVGYVGQRFDLLSGTIAENIAAGRPLSTEAIVAAAKAAGAHEVIMQRPHGYETLIGERGTARFSGGELQRLAIARALAGAPRLLLLDEPTSALDAESEAALLRTLEQAGAGRTVILLAHRLGFARRADRILVLDGGRLVEQGPHAELLARGGLYAALWKEHAG